MEQVEDLGKITIVKDGQEVECDIIFTFDNEELEKRYIAFTDYTKDENGRQNIYFGAIRPNIDYEKLEYNQLDKVTSKEELAMLQDVLNQITEL